MLGRLVWSDDENGWSGTAGGMSFVISRARTATATPPEQLLSYARGILAQRDWLLEQLTAARAEAARGHGAFYEREIADLTYECISFYDRRGTPAIIANLDGGRDYRAWRIEFLDRQCEGIGFDS